MSRTQQAIDASNGRALIGYLPAGYPDQQGCVDACVALAEGGFTAIELGLPYSDPSLDGPVIQAATQGTLDRGFRIEEAFETIAEVTRRTSIPVLVMTYWNPVLRWGVDRFAGRLAEAGGAGLITPDLVPENGAEWMAASEHHDLDRIFLAAPSSSDERLDVVLQASRGFVYTVSTMGTTGARGEMDTAARTLADRLDTRRTALGLDLPRCVGLGISTGAQVADVLGYAEGAITGSALVAALRDGGQEGLRARVADLAAGTLVQSH
ncbi:tryptophan synthase subunit alpha [Agrococcus jejuensis]|uniref:Tryptophan synthase alpha chain n=1 Tax=Agrococcus jejuensis TaxID=399736 RepID=A0A1G7ZQC9_9MICO|nr:tryptophan synthase subunit alpha [Agrococcus jejuensis]SDH10320.1 tryptophan synthase, alpha chain [Agrococcus jejuensis]